MNEYEFHLMQLADSFFPSGTFGLSGGLESLVKSGRVRNHKDVLQLVRRQLRFQILPCDCVILAIAMDAARLADVDRIVEADNQYYSMKLVKEVRTASTRSGKQLLRTLSAMKDEPIARKFQMEISDGRSAGTYPVCLAIAAFSFRIPVASAVRMILYSYSVGIVGSAIRLGIISHVEGQMTLTELARNASSRPARELSEVWQLNPLAEILQMQHEQDEFRMFIT
jgi:urease accessory protein